MGYTTKFEGSFKLSTTPPIEVIAKLDGISDAGEFPEGPTPWPEPRWGCCDWVLTEDDQGIEWSGAEKFYDYVEFLQAIIDNILTPAGLKLSGEVKYQGEGFNDRGVLRIIGDKVVKEKIPVVITDLPAFKAFIVKTYGEEAIQEYLEYQECKGFKP